MNNKYVYMIVAAIVAIVANYVHGIEQLADKNAWLYGMILAIALGAGSTGGSDVVSILVEGITGYINTMILFVVFGVVYKLLKVLAFGGEALGGDAVMGAVFMGINLAVAALFTNITVSYLRKAS